MTQTPPFADFLPATPASGTLRAEIARLTRLPETELIPDLVRAARVDAETRARIAATARALVEGLRQKRRGGGVEGLVQEYALSSDEGVALMCLAEALLRIPDAATRDALIRDKIAGGDWRAHLEGSKPLFVNAATWGLVVTGKLTSLGDQTGLSAALTRLVARAGEPVIRRGVALAMRLMGEQFVTGQTIDEALRRAKTLESKGFSYSYDMLGEAATTAKDAARYLSDYETAIAAIGAASAGRGIHAGPGISIKLSALHPRYSRAQSARVQAELLPRVKALCLQAKRHNIGLNIDAEEADRLELSLDLLEALALDPDLAGWDGLGFVVQAYGKRCPAVLEFIIDLAGRAGRRMMVRLVKGAYWDSEIKRAQVDGLSDFPVYTRKIHTDVAYLACAKKLLAARDRIFPQFATHNAQTAASIYHFAGPEFSLGDYEFQCLHGMGEPLYRQVVGPEKLNRPCRIYAPVGTHETLLAYLVRRLLENGANSSFVNRLGDASVPVESLIEDPAELLSAEPLIGAPHQAIKLPKDLFGTRLNSAGLDLASEAVLVPLQQALQQSAARAYFAAPSVLEAEFEPSVRRNPVLNPADPRDQVGEVIEADTKFALKSLDKAAKAFPLWSEVPAAQRATALERAADAMQEDMPKLIGLLVREAGKSAANAVSEVREAIDFLRFYAAEVRQKFGPAQRPLGVVVCISPWNFPLAIFTGQIAAALASGNTVVAKPANTTPLIAAEAVRLLHQAGIPEEALQFLPCPGAVAGELTANPLVAAVMFTGSTAVARKIQTALAGRVDAFGQPIPLIAETGGQNAMIVDSSALPEQVVGDVIASAFDSAGQRCSALRVLCLQEDIADKVLTMLKGALDELALGPTDHLSNDIGPVITAAAKAQIEAHIQAMSAQGFKATRLGGAGALEAPRDDLFVAPTVIEIDQIGRLTQEVFGPVLHVLRYKRGQLAEVIQQINATGYGLTFGLHTRIAETVQSVTSRIHAGNLYVNRNTIGAVVGSQPFGGMGLSGTGPKAGGPLYLGRLVCEPPNHGFAASSLDPAWAEFSVWAQAKQIALPDEPRLNGLVLALPGPVGESNLYQLRPRGRVLLLPQTERGLARQISAALAAGNDLVIDAPALQADFTGLPSKVLARMIWSSDWLKAGPIAGALIEGDAQRVAELTKKIAALPGQIVLAQAERSGTQPYRAEWLVEEQVISTNTTAAGGNASLMALS